MWLFVFLGAVMAVPTPLQSTDPPPPADSLKRGAFKSPPSPLDLHSTTDAKPTHRLSDEDLLRLPLCQRQCADGLSGTMNTLFHAKNHVERYKEVCRKYVDTARCIEETAYCGDQEMFQVMTSGLRYMCVEQKNAFNATIECMDATSSQVIAECEGQCGAKNMFLNWVTRYMGVGQGIGEMMGNTLQDMGATGGATVLNTIGKEFARGQSMDMNFFRTVSNDFCKVSECYLSCLRSKMNARCEGSAGALVSELFVRPIASTQEKFAMLGPLSGLTAMILPDQCQFLVDGSTLQKHRIDDSLDAELKRMYGEKEKAEKETQAEEDFSQLFSLPTGEKSPFETGEDIVAAMNRFYGRSSQADSEGSASRDEASGSENGSGLEEEEESGEGVLVVEGSGEGSGERPREKRHTAQWKSLRVRSHAAGQLICRLRK